jgi:PadR family transcriptional regulator, regulatory protein PadR
MTWNRKTSPQAEALLDALLEQPRKWKHGYELSKKIGLKSGTLYPLLIRLSDRGFLESDWQPPDKSGTPPRHVYRLTAKGLETARERADARIRSASMSGLIKTPSRP